MDMPGFPVHHQLPELSQTHVLQDGDAIQPSHPLSSPSQHGMSVIIQIPYNRATLTWVSVSIIILIYFLLLSPLMAEESVFILDIYSFTALLICVISLSQVLLKVYHSFSMTFWRISFLFQCFNLFSVLNVISLCSYLSRSFFLLNLGLFCPFSSF